MIMIKRSIFLLIVAALIVPVGFIVAAPPTDTEFNTRAQEMREAHNAFKEARSLSAGPGAGNTNATVGQGQTQEQILERREEQRMLTLQKAVEVQEGYFERVRNRIEQMPNISDAEKARLMQQTDTTLAGLEAKRAEIASAVGVDALIGLAARIRTSFMGDHEIVKGIVNGIHASRIGKNPACSRADASRHCLAPVCQALRKPPSSSVPSTGIHVLLSFIIRSSAFKKLLRASSGGMSSEKAMNRCPGMVMKAVSTPTDSSRALYSMDRSSQSPALY